MKKVWRRAAKPVTKTLTVLAYIVSFDSIDIVDSKTMIEKIHAKNAASIQGLKIEWIGWLSTLTSRKKKLSLVIECRVAMQVNKAINGNLTIKS